MAFAASIKLQSPEPTSFNQPPQYFSSDSAGYDLSILRKRGLTGTEQRLNLNPQEYLRDQWVRQSLHDSLRLQTTLDEGQATALCENLSRGLAFTQGPPGTGKTFLGVSLAKVLLASRDSNDSKPIMVVCMTNHALDSFLGDLRKDGIDKLVRLGGGSNEQWTKQFGPQALSRRVKGLPSNRGAWALWKNRVEGLAMLIFAIRFAYESQGYAFRARGLPTPSTATRFIGPQFDLT